MHPMNRTFPSTGMALACATACALVMCARPYGSVSREAVVEALRSERVAITPRMPGWLLKKEQIYRLNAVQLARVREILTPDKVRAVGEEYYRDETSGNRNDNSSRIFYLYAENGQSLGGRIVGDKALMDDFDLSDAECRELYAMFRSVLDKVANE